MTAQENGYDLNTNKGQISAAIGGGVGIGAGLLAASLLANMQRKVVESGLDSAAWRYASLRTANAK